MSLAKKIILIIAIIVIGLLGMWFATIWHDLVEVPIRKEHQDALTFVFPSGSNARDLARELNRMNLLKHPRAFNVLARIYGTLRVLKAGEYSIDSQTTSASLLKDIASGKGITHSITFVEGWTFQQMIQALEEDRNILHTPELAQHIMKMLGHPDQQPEGLFFPDTYSYFWGNRDTDILKLAYERMQSVLEKEWQQRSIESPVEDPYRALIIASLIEKETALANERPLVAGVILQRLQKHMFLQIDPTVLYGLNLPSGTWITKENLLDRTSYNTYRHKGLPPTPICLPSRASISAALHPKESEFLYYVSKGDGSHLFSKTYEEHLSAVEHYLWYKFPLTPIPFSLPWDFHQQLCKLPSYAQ